MWHHESDVFALQSISFHQVHRQIGHAPHSVFKYLRAFLMDVVHFLSDGFDGGRIERPAARHVEVLPARTIYVMLEIENAFVSACRLNQNGTRTVAEKYAR